MRNVSFDENDAPEGFKAVASDGWCDGCHFFRMDGDVGCAGGSDANCIGPFRKDGKSCIFVKLILTSNQ